MRDIELADYFLYTFKVRIVLVRKNGRFIQNSVQTL